MCKLNNRTYTKLSQQGHAVGNRPCKGGSLRRQTIYCLKPRLHLSGQDSTFVQGKVKGELNSELSTTKAILCKSK